MKKLQMACIALLAVGMMACEQKEEKHPGFTDLGNELFIKKEIATEGSRKPVQGDVMTMNIRCTDAADSVIIDTKNSPEPAIVPADTNQPGIMKAFLALNEGDSATVIMPAYDFFTRGLPPQMDSSDVLYFYIQSLSVSSMEEFQAKRQAEVAALQAKEPELRAAYIEENGITATPRESGLYYIPLEEGNGPMPKEGDEVRVHYRGTLLDGTVFDASYDRGEPIPFKLGKGQVIPGWDEGIGLMRKGGKAKLIIPSELAYGGAPDRGVIKPFSTLVFEVELVDVVSE